MRRAAIWQVHSLDAYVEVVFHIAWIGQYRSAVRICVPRLFLYLKRM